MKQNKKGFTLIELLAVIVILAIIALIATPIVLNMISTAKKSAAKSSALGYIDSINSFIPISESASDLGITDEDYSGVKVPTGVKCVKDNTGWIVEDAASDTTPASICADFYAKVDKKTKGGKPTGAADKKTEITISNGQVAANSIIQMSGYTCTYGGTDMDCK